MKNSLLPVPTPPPGSPSATIEVSAEPPLIDSTTGQVTHTYDGVLLQGGSSGAVGGPVYKSKPPTKPASKDERKQVESKLSAELLQLYDCAVSQKVSTPGGTCKPRSGPVKVKLELTSTSAEIVQKLVRAGFKIEHGANTTELTGSILPQQLKRLAEIAEVESISLAK
jgi:hypothetical protein